MKYRIMIFTLFVTLFCLFSGCSSSGGRELSNSADASNKSSISHSNNSTTDIEQSKESGSSLDIDNDYDSNSNPSSLDDMGLQSMTTVNQKYYDKYLKPFNNALPFLHSFSAGKFEFFSAPSVFCSLTTPETFTTVSQDAVEELIKQYFPITSDEMRSLAGIHDYSSEAKTYEVPMYIEGKDWRGVVTASTESDDKLILYCDWYQSREGEPTAGSFEMRGKSITTIELNSDDSWIYLENSSTVFNS